MRFITSHIPVLWRSKDEVQIGLHPMHALRMPIDAAHKYLTASVNTQQKESSKTATAHLQDAEPIADPAHYIAYQREDLTKEQKANRLNTEIVIQGAGRMGTTIAILLAGAGYPLIRIHDDQKITSNDLCIWGASRVDIGSRRDHTAHLLIERIHRGTWPSILRRTSTASQRLTILCPDPVTDWPWFAPNLTDKLLASDQAHMVLASGPTNIHISSVIEPGLTSCMKCRDAHLTDADASWPLLTSQLIGRPPLDLAPSGLILFAAHFATQLVNEWVDGRLVHPNRLWDISWPSMATEFTEMFPHPACGCSWNQFSRD
jgi:hypothetical protein